LVGFTSLVSYWGGQHFHYSLGMRIAENTPTSHFTIKIMKVLSWSTMRVHDVVSKSAIYYPHHASASFIAKRLHEENSRALLAS
jgi:hypothetical protein